MAMAQREKAIDLAARIKEIRSQIEALEPLWQELGRLEAEFDGILSGGSSNGSRERPPAHKINGMVEGSIAARVVELLEANPHQSFDSNEIMTRLGIRNAQTARSTLIRLSDRGMIKRSGRGQYGAKGGAT